MKALVLYCPDYSLGASPGASHPLATANQLRSMGIDIVWLDMRPQYTAAQFSNIVGEVGADMIVVPGANGAVTSDIGFIRAGQLASEANNVPLFIAGIGTTAIEFVSAVDAGTASYKATIVRTGGTIYTQHKHLTLAAATGTEVITPLVVREDDTSLVACGKYSPDGEYWVYFDILNNGVPLLHLMIQEAVNDGVLAKPPTRAAHILMIDHLNGPGDSAGMGTVGQPEITQVLGDMLRAGNGVCYASLEQGQAAGHTETQLGYMREYADVFRYIATHDHSNTNLTDAGYIVGGLAAGAPLYNQETKAKIDASYQSTKTMIEGVGLSVSTDLAHFAGNYVGTNWFELGQSGTDITADPLNATAKEGYGFRIARCADESVTAAYPTVPNNSGVHFLANPVKYRGILCLSSADVGIDNGAEVDLTKDLLAFERNLYLSTKNQSVYWHETDFEDPALNGSGLVSDGTAFSRGRLSWQTGLNYQAACPDTFNWGASVDDILGPRNATPNQYQTALASAELIASLSSQLTEGQKTEIQAIVAAL